MALGICLLCGLPGAGKTTVAEYLKKNCPLDCKLIHICYDKLMPRIDLEKDTNAWKLARASIIQHIEKLLLYVTSHIPDNKSVISEDNGKLIDSELQAIYSEIQSCQKMPKIVFIIDDNMHYRGMRYEYHKICCAHSVGLCIIYFDISLEKCLENNQKRLNVVPAATIKKLHHQIEVPGSNPKNKWEKYVIRLNLNEVCQPDMRRADIFSLISESMEHPPTPPPTENLVRIEESRMVNRKNFIHQADICLRRYISSHMKLLKNDQSEENNMKEISQKLNSAKKSVTLLLKMGFVDESEYFDDNELVNLELLESKICKLMDSELV